MMTMSATRKRWQTSSGTGAAAYLITGMSGHWLAQRRDNGRTLKASGPDGLRELMIEDYAARPVSRERRAGVMTGPSAPPRPPRCAPRSRSTRSTCWPPGGMTSPGFEVVSRDPAAARTA